MNHPGFAEGRGTGFSNLIPGILIRRYKRFLADVRLQSGKVVTAHCPNPGRMSTCCDPGSRVYLSLHDSIRRKYRYTWELIQMPGSMVGVNPVTANRIVHQSLCAGRIPSLAGYDAIHAEVSAGQGVRLDFLLEGAEKSCFLEVKSCTLVENRAAGFPDAVTARGLKHLVHMQRLMSDGFRCVLLFLVQRTDAEIFKPADDVDPVYGRQLRAAVSRGLEILVYDVRFDPDGIVLNNPLPINLQQADVRTL
ncbi:MAG: DNA/RNA nuclease SfsA [Desulfobacterales bacterium]|jgi:sugar fermentation stimulation protein A|nr:DNA/RNA nuclease SfsA [Desulfobacterales bacterium]MDD3081262.1 DNA/RNA nuclease SfsA [Desulfobacterales bacterium]MDD3949947.1 DNA/RNA nuclease SfsA [Desulfobacterales bacterium]MDD4463844.1 DNA/RNA nuclease SfsA [Desulfobacterales bacterium]MDY0377548.1 DNA/RNA nuclease SfsA [Desulfobacterales bacterium]